MMPVPIEDQMGLVVVNEGICRGEGPLEIYHESMTTVEAMTTEGAVEAAPAGDATMAMPPTPTPSNRTDLVLPGDLYDTTWMTRGTACTTPTFAS